IVWKEVSASAKRRASRNWFPFSNSSSMLSSAAGVAVVGRVPRLVTGVVLTVRFLISGFFGRKMPAPPPTSEPTSWANARGTAKDNAVETIVKDKTERKTEEIRIDLLLMPRDSRARTR